MKRRLFVLCLALALSAMAGRGQEATITIQADRVQHRVSPYLTGACIEDVNHEVYGGIDSQMVFGESFAEPAPPLPLTGFKAYGGRWTPLADGSLEAAGGDGPKLVCQGPEMSVGEASVDLWFGDKGGGNAGLILKVSQAATGADRFTGYEVSLEPSGTLVLGRHRQNWEPLRRVPCEVPLKQWVTLRVVMSTNSLEVFVNDKSLVRYEDMEHPLGRGLVGLRTWQRDARFRNLWVQADGARRNLPFVYAQQGWGGGVSGMWRGFRQGEAEGTFALDTREAFSGHQSQRITFGAGTGEVGIENQGLNRWGMHLVKGKKYEGYLYAQVESPTEIFVAFESRDGANVHAEQRLKLQPGGWRRVDFTLKPGAADKAGRFAVKLKQPGTVTLGYAFVQPGAWGRFQGLPVRKDVAQGLVGQGLTILRQGGCMANAAEYRWKKMIGPRAMRPPYTGWWYPHSSNGWGIFEFLNFCEAAGFVAVPDVNMNETPQDMADFIEYVNGPARSEWGSKRVRDGHPKPYGLKYLQIGNEEQLNERYWEKFKPIAEAVWAKDPSIILVVGDFAYGQTIKDPFNFTGAAGRITSLMAHEKILQLARQHDREVWFDIHINTDGPRPDFGGTFSYVDALEKLARGAKHRVVIFEFNAGNHAQKRALANAAAINAVERDGRLPIATSANCLQPDGQNDNDWDQGLLFLNPSQVWLQPPGYVTQMVSSNYEPLLVNCRVQSPGDELDVTAKRSEDGKTLVLQVVNFTDRSTTALLNIAGFNPTRRTAEVQTLAGPLEARNTAERPRTVVPVNTQWQHELKRGSAAYTFPPHSFTVIRF